MCSCSEILVAQLSVGGFDHNFSYVIYDGGQNYFLVDPTGNCEVINHFLLSEFGSGYGRPRGILLTHSHLDHCENVEYFRNKLNVPVYAHAFSRYPEFVPLKDQDRIKVDERWFVECIYTPGHTEDSVCYRLSNDCGIFTGDTLFVDYCGFGNPEELYESLYRRLAGVKADNVVYSGHDYGRVPCDTIGEEREHNYYLTAKNYAEFKLRWELMK